MNDKIQGNNRLLKIKTPESMRAGKHVFRRYLFDDPYAEEMKCRCGLIIWPVYSEKEALEALKEFDVEPNDCIS